MTVAQGEKDLLWFLAEGTAGTVGEQFFQRLVEHIAAAFRAEVAFVAEVVPEDREFARFLACWAGDRLAEPVEYCLEGTPCAEVTATDIVSYPVGVQERFPADEMLVQLDLEGYLAVPLRGSDGDHLGHLGVLSRAPLHPEPERLAAMRIFAAHASTELERRRHEERLRMLVDEQAALRRVATLVAAGATEQEVFDAVSAEVASLLAADVAALIRLDGDTATFVAQRATREDVPVPVGLVVGLDQLTATRDAMLTGRPARADDALLHHEPVPELRRMKLRSAVSAPITVAGRVWGAVSAARTREDPLPPTAERRLFDFAELLAQAIANAEARAELAASRARIVQAGDEERRRIERNLHDGAQQRLVALSLTLRMAQNALGGDPRAAMLARASEEAQLTLQDLRELARGIHPAILSERGLAAALEALASRSPVPVDLDVADERLPAPVEATAYYVVAECLANVAKYAGECSVDVTVARKEDALRVEVRDDGCGGAEVEAGTGLRGLTDRVEALHGTLRIESPRGDGTLVSAVIPL